MTEDKGGRMVNAEGKETEKNVWGKQSPWVDYYGPVAGKTVGVAIFDNPGNPRHPTYWHSRAYGLFAANPFGLHDFTGDKSKDGSMTALANTLSSEGKLIFDRANLPNVQAVTFQAPAQ